MNAYDAAWSAAWCGESAEKATRAGAARLNADAEAAGRAAVVAARSRLGLEISWIPWEPGGPTSHIVQAEDAIEVVSHSLQEGGGS